MSVYDNYMSFPGVNNVWGGKASTWNNFVKKVRSEYRKDGKKSPTMKQLSKMYNSSNCGKTKYTKGSKKLCKSKSVKSSSCKGYTSKLKKLKSKSAKSSLRKKCKGYTKRGGEIDMFDESEEDMFGGDAFGGDVFGGECAVCRGAGLYGGCSCCGMGLMGGTQNPNTKKRCVGTKATYNRLLDIYKRMQWLGLRYNTENLSPAEKRDIYARLNRYRGAFREMLSLYARQNNIGTDFLRLSDSDFRNKFPGAKTAFAIEHVPFMPPAKKLI